MLFFSNIYSSLWTESNNSELLLHSVLKNLSHIKNPILQKHSMCWKGRVIFEQTSLCFPREMHFFNHLRSVENVCCRITEEPTTWEFLLHFILDPPCSMSVPVQSVDRAGTEQGGTSRQGLPVPLWKNVTGHGMTITAAWDYECLLSEEGRHLAEP